LLMHLPGRSSKGRRGDSVTITIGFGEAGRVKGLKKLLGLQGEKLGGEGEMDGGKKSYREKRHWGGKKSRERGRGLGGLLRRLLAEKAC